MTKPIPVIRPYYADDIEAVISVWQKANALAHPFLAADFVAEVHQAMRELYLPNVETYVLEDRGAVVGFIALLDNEIGGLFLEPTCHGRGYGRALVDHALALKGPLKVGVFRDNAIGRPFYENYGFEFVEDVLHEPSGQVNRKMAMPGASNWAGSNNLSCEDGAENIQTFTRRHDVNTYDNDMIIALHRQAFGAEEGPEIADLTEKLLAEPGVVSICAEREGKLAGNVLFTPFVFEDHPEAKCALLAPLGVLPDYQRSGVGKEVMEVGIAQLKALGVDAVFVLGVPSYYPQYGFVPTEKETPYPDLLTIPEAWMVLELTAGSVKPLRGRTVAVKPFMQSVYWDTSAYG